MSRMKPPPEHNPALDALVGLIGDWELELSNAAFLPDPSDTVHSLASFVWIEDGALIALYQGDRALGAPDARWIIGRDQDADTDTFTVLYYDTRGVARVYGMRFGGGAWELWRDNPAFAQRFTARLSDDGRVITGSWQKRLGAGEWEHDFDLTYRRVAG